MFISGSFELFGDPLSFLSPLVVFGNKVPERLTRFSYCGEELILGSEFGVFLEKFFFSGILFVKVQRVEFGIELTRVFELNFLIGLVIVRQNWANFKLVFEDIQ